MPSDARNSRSADASEPRKGPGRPRQPAADSHKQKIERLQAELKEAQEALRVSEEKRASIVGHASLRHARHNTEFARQLAAALRAEIRSKADRATVADLLNDSPSPAPTSE